MAKNPRLENPYYKQDGDLSFKHFEDAKIFEQLTDAIKVSHLEASMWEYGENLLDKNMKATAVDLGVLTPPSSSFDTYNSLLTTAANVLSHIPKWLIFILTASEALKTVCAFPKYNPILDNSGAVDHGSAGNAKIMYNVKYHLLENKNCIAFGATLPMDEQGIVDSRFKREIYVKCLNGHCPNQEFISTKGAEFVYSVDELVSSLTIDSSDYNQVDLTFHYIKYEDQGKQLYPQYIFKNTFTCNLPLSPGNKHLEQSINLLSNHNYTGALDKVNEALRIDPNFESAIAYKKTILQSLPSTTTTNSTTPTEKTTTPVEPYNAPFKNIDTPTTTQNSTNQGWSVGNLYNAALSGILTVATIGVLLFLFTKKVLLFTINALMDQKNHTQEINRVVILLTVSHYQKIRQTPR